MIWCDFLEWLIPGGGGGTECEDNTFYFYYIIIRIFEWLFKQCWEEKSYRFFGRSLLCGTNERICIYSVYTRKGSVFDDGCQWSAKRLRGYCGIFSLLRPTIISVGWDGRTRGYGPPHGGWASAAWRLRPCPRPRGRFFPRRKFDWGDERPVRQGEFDSTRYDSPRVPPCLPAWP